MDYILVCHTDCHMDHDVFYLNPNSQMKKVTFWAETSFNKYLAESRQNSKVSFC